MDIQGKNVLVFGSGISGEAAAGLLAEHGARVILYDGNEKLNKDEISKRVPEGTQIILGGFPEDILDSLNLVVMSPGVPTDLPVVEQMKAKGIPVWGEIELAYTYGKGDVLAITGTNGKTTTVTLLYRLFTGLGYHCGLLSTIANYVGSKRFEAINTTADPITVNSLLARMVDEGCEYCFMEVSSIGMQQERVTGLRFKAGIFSNLTHDHLDYHKTFAEYLRCKKMFFDMLPSDAYAITNTDDRNGMVMVQNTAAKVITYSCRSIADHTCRVIEEGFDGMLLRIDGTESWTRLTGRHNAYNILAIYTTAVTLGASPEEVLVAVSRLEPAPGRLETMRGPQDRTVVIDYAHTPDALENVLTTLRDIAPDRELICLFGCGGDRDRTKRPEMAQVAQRLADRIIVTSDNSRTERTEDIMEDIKAGMDAKGRAKSLFISDRKEAIRTAIMLSGPGATVLLAGKGHETYQIIGTEKHHFDEREIVTDIFKDMQ